MDSLPEIGTNGYLSARHLASGPSQEVGCDERDSAASSPAARRRKDRRVKPLPADRDANGWHNSTGEGVAVSRIGRSCQEYGTLSPDSDDDCPIPVEYRMRRNLSMDPPSLSEAEWLEQLFYEQKIQSAPVGSAALSGADLSARLTTPLPVALNLGGRAVVWSVSIAQLRAAILAQLPPSAEAREQPVTLAQGSYLSWLLGALKYEPQDLDIAIKTSPHTPNQREVVAAIERAVLHEISLAFPTYFIPPLLAHCGVHCEPIVSKEVSLASYSFSLKGGKKIDISVQFLIDHSVDFTTGSLRLPLDPFFGPYYPREGYVYSCLLTSVDQVLKDVKERELKTPFPELTYRLIWRYLTYMGKKGFKRNPILEEGLLSRMVRDLNKPLARQVRDAIELVLDRSLPHHTLWAVNELSEWLAQEELPSDFRQVVVGSLREVWQRVARDTPKALESERELPPHWNEEEKRAVFRLSLRKLLREHESGMHHELTPAFRFQLRKVREESCRYNDNRFFTCLIDLAVIIGDSPVLTRDQKSALLGEIHHQISSLKTRWESLSAREISRPFHAFITCLKAELAMADGIAHQLSDDSPRPESLSPFLRAPSWLGEGNACYIFSPFSTLPHLEYLRLVERLSRPVPDSLLKRAAPLLAQLFKGPLDSIETLLPYLISHMVDDLRSMRAPDDDIIAFCTRAHAYAPEAALLSTAAMWLPAEHKKERVALEAAPSQPPAATEERIEVMEEVVVEPPPPEIAPPDAPEEVQAEEEVEVELASLPSSDLLRALAKFNGDYSALVSLIEEHGGAYRLLGMEVPTRDKIADRIRWAEEQPDPDWKLVAWKLTLLYPDDPFAQERALRLLPQLLRADPKGRAIMAGATHGLLFKEILPQSAFKSIAKSPIDLARAICPRWVVIAEELVQEWERVPDVETQEDSAWREIAIHHTDYQRAIEILRGLSEREFYQIDSVALLERFGRFLDRGVSPDAFLWICEKASELLQNAPPDRSDFATEAVVDLATHIAHYDLESAQTFVSKSVSRLKWLGKEARKEVVQALIAGLYWHQTEDRTKIERLLTGAVKSRAFAPDNDQDRELFFAALDCLIQRGGFEEAVAIIDLHPPFLRLREEQQATLLSIVGHFAAKNSKEPPPGQGLRIAQRFLQKTAPLHEDEARHFSFAMINCLVEHQQWDAAATLFGQMPPLANFQGDERKTLLSIAFHFAKESSCRPEEAAQQLDKAHDLLKRVKGDQTPTHTAVELYAIKHQLNEDLPIAKRIKRASRRLTALEEQGWPEGGSFCALRLELLHLLADLCDQLPRTKEHRLATSECAFQLGVHIALAHEQHLFHEKGAGLHAPLLVRTAALLARSHMGLHVEAIGHLLRPIAAKCSKTSSLLVRHQIEGWARIDRLDQALSVGRLPKNSLPVARAYIRAQQWDDAKAQLKEIEATDRRLAQVGWLYYAKVAADRGKIKIMAEGIDRAKQAAALPDERHWSLMQSSRLKALLRGQKQEGVEQAASLLCAPEAERGIALLRADLEQVGPILNDLLKELYKEAMSPERAVQATTLLGMRLKGVQEAGEVIDLLKSHLAIQVDPLARLRQFVHLVECYKLYQADPELTRSTASQLIGALASTYEEGSAALAKALLIWSEEKGVWGEAAEARADAWCAVCKNIVECALVHQSSSDKEHFLEAYNLLSYAFYRLKLFDADGLQSRNSFVNSQAVVTAAMELAGGTPELLSSYTLGKIKFSAMSFSPKKDSIAEQREPLFLGTDGQLVKPSARKSRSKRR